MSDTPRERRWPRRLLLAYLALLALSYVVWFLRDTTPPFAAGELAIEVPVVAGERVGPERVRLAYRDVGARPDEARATLLFLHGSPGSAHDFDSVLPHLPADLRCVIPDLPGFGASTREVPDYGAAAHARYVLDLLDELHLERVHVVAFSMGGAVAAELVALAPERVESLLFVSALGVEELELFGDHDLNHAVHAAQLRGLQLLRLVVPHFGAADASPLNLPYARNFHDTDQRRVRPALSAWEGPLFVLHGERDFLVPLEAAEETHRIVPQSELEVLPGGHFMVWLRPKDVAARVASWVARVAAGDAPTRARATPERVARAALPFDPSVLPPASGPTLLLLVLLLAVGTFVSEDLTCIAAGLLVAQGRLGFTPAVAGCTLGIFLGDVGLFLAGRWLGRPVVRRAPVRWFLSQDALERASEWFRRRGPSAIFVSRFMPGLRLPTYFAAGVLRTSLPRFAGYFLLAVLVWTPVLVGFAWVFGAEALELLKAWGPWALLAVIALLLFVERVVVRLFTFRGRRALVGSWRRWTRWEFWPPWFFYPPVLLYVAWLALRYRGLRLLTAVNPGIPTGGFIGEPKSLILGELQGDHGLVPAFELLTTEQVPEARAARALAFAERHGWPVVFKPEVGQRGSGVLVVRDADDLADHARRMEVDHLLQEFVPGPEFGLFYVREAGAARGRLFSITEKRLPELVGDGVHTVEELILLGERSVAAAPHYLRLHVHELGRVLAEGERLRLVDVGTHCRGAIFLDGEAHRTPALEDAVEELSRGFAGFCFGRYDVRAESLEALHAGRFRVLELNGLTAESTNIYDPRTPLRAAYRTLFTQWRLAFAIAAANRAAGAPLSSWAEVLRELLGYRTKQRAHHA